MSHVTSSGRPAVGRYCRAFSMVGPAMSMDLPSLVLTTMLANGNRLAFGNPPRAKKLEKVTN